jgi:hypothetical protein
VADDKNLTDRGISAPQKTGLRCGWTQDEEMALELAGCFYALTVAVHSAKEARAAAESRCQHDRKRGRARLCAGLGDDLGLVD